MNILSWLSTLINTFMPKPKVAGTKDWSSSIPPWTSQVSVPNRLDAEDCLSESLINCVYMLTGFDASPRALAKLSKTTPAGNSETAVLNAANTYGLIPYEAWPTPDTFTWEEYYADIPADVLAKAVPVTITKLPPDLNLSPLWTIIAWGLNLPQPTYHGVAQLNLTQYFDSEVGSPIKPLTYEGATIVQQNSLQVTIHSMQLINDNGTVFLVGEKGKIGIADPEALAKFEAVTAQITNGSTTNIPQVGVFKSQSDSLLVNN